MKVKYKDKEIELHYSLRIYMIYENIMGETPAKEDYMTLVTLMFATLVGTLQRNREPIDIDYQGFLDWIDDNGGIKLLMEFSRWFSDEAMKQMDLIGEPEELEKKETVLDKKLKKNLSQ